jgi:hypothetical protein
LTYSSKLRKWKAEEAEDAVDQDDPDEDIVMVEAPMHSLDTSVDPETSPSPKHTVSQPTLI